MRCYMRNTYLALAIMIIFLSPTQSMDEQIEPSEASEANPNACASLEGKLRINLTQINVTNTIYAIETADGEWHAPNSNNMANIEGYIPSESDNVIYLISVSNTDSNNSLKDILVFDELPDGMIFSSSSITMDGQTSSQIYPIVRGNNLVWEIDEIEPNTQVIIKHVAAFHRINDLRRFENKVYVNGTWDTECALIRDQSQVVTSVIPAKT